MDYKKSRGIPPRNKAWRAAAGAILLALFLITPVSAHHSFSSEYDESKLITVSGTLTRFDWTNPHAMMYIDGKDENGKAAIWRFEMGSPGGLIHRGWKKTDLKVGDQITVDGFAAKDGTNLANARIVITPGGRKLFGGFQSTPGAPAR